ncbi:MOSC domain-containing protein [Croceibacterium mercuriale]|uniref:MOSC domain-containing protein n=1 Tax=Croceibacterium mercuriale TaxID=1572751 RepID=UPI00068FEA98|nr:MOSC domain-containing protein [Croceibacterium mercuriale]
MQTDWQASAAGEAQAAAGGRLAGIARRDRSRGEIQHGLGHVHVSRAAGIAGDFRGALAAQKSSFKRQVSLIEAESWAAAIEDLRLDLPWWVRRNNLLVHGVRLPRQEKFVLGIGDECRLLVTMECDPCSRMEEIAPGLKAALLPDWRGGFLAEVIADGDIAVGDQVRIEL